MDKYPLQVSIPRTEVARSTLRFRHTAYLIEIDDCGKVYTRHRRYTNFAWLHGELRRRELGCALPELPPKKAVGNMDQAFVDRRRQTLEDYLRALIRLPAVVQDDALWAFLDADLATAVVPRFLCRPHSQMAAAECLAQLERVVARPANLFRLCSPAVLAEFASFAKAEAEEPSRPAPAAGEARGTGLPPQLQQAGLQARLGNRIRFCQILKPLIVHERARQGLVEHGMFGALLAQLSRTTDDMEVSDDACELHKSICAAVTDCLQRLLEGSKGAALLHFCQQDDGLGALRRLANGPVSLHPVCASLLWHGLLNPGVVMALVGPHARGLPLLGSLLKSPDLCARVLAALSIASVVRHEGALDGGDTEHCLQALQESWPEELDAAENAAIERTAAVALERAVSASFAGAGSLLSGTAFSAAGGLQAAAPLETDDAASEVPESAAGGREAPTAALAPRCSTLAPLLKVERDQQLVELLKTLCSPKELPRLHLLLGQPSGQADADAVTHVVVVLLDHFVQQFAEEPSKLRELSELAPQLQLLVETTPAARRDEEDWTMEGPQTGIPDQVRVRAARILIRLEWPKDSEAPGEPPPLDAFGRRARILEVLTRNSAMDQEMAQAHLARAQKHFQMQSNQVADGGLTEALCIGEARLAEFARETAGLEAKRATLDREVQTSQQGIDAMLASLERRGIARGVLDNDVDALRKGISQRSQQENRTQDSQQHAADGEALVREAVAQVEAAVEQKKQAEVRIAGADSNKRLAESKCAELQRREVELFEICNTAPAQLARVQARIAEHSKDRASLAESVRQLASKCDQGERWAAALQTRDAEAKGALKGVQEVQRELEIFQSKLNSETILTDPELERLRELDSQLQPSRPSRLRRGIQSVGSDINDTAGGTLDGFGDESGAPLWEDMPAEQEFRSSPNFRSFSKLCQERKQMWEAEALWVKDQISRTEAKAADITRQRWAQEQQEHQVAQEEASLQSEAASLADFDGHAQRHNEAHQAANEARAAHQQASADASEALAEMQLAESRVAQAESQGTQAEAELLARKDAARGEAVRALQVRKELEAQTTELESRCRDYIQEWRAVELEEHRLKLLQVRVGARLNEEANGRQHLRAEAQRLIMQLQELDQQLDVPAVLNVNEA